MNVIKVPIMYQVNNFKLLYDPLLHCMVVLLDYVGNSTFYFILTELEELDHIIKALNQFTLQRWSESVITRYFCPFFFFEVHGFMSWFMPWFQDSEVV